MLTRELAENELFRKVALASIQPSFGEIFGAALDIPTLGGLAQTQLEYEAAQSGERVQYRNAREAYQARLRALSQGVQPGYREPVPDEEYVQPDQLNADYKDLGLKFDRPTTRDAAEVLARGKRAEMARDSVLANARGASGITALLAGGFLASMTDPLEAGLALIPIPGLQARTIARFGAIGGRVAAGATEGALFGAATEPFVLSLAQQQQLDYELSDALLSVGFGALFGAGIGGIVGAVRSRRSLSDRPGDPEILGEQPSTRIPEEVAQAPQEVRLQAFRAALAQTLEGRRVEVSEFFTTRTNLRSTTAAGQYYNQASGVRGDIEFPASAAVPEPETPRYRERDGVVATRDKGDGISFDTKESADKFVDSLGISARVEPDGDKFRVVKDLEGQIVRRPNGDIESYKTERSAQKRIDRTSLRDQNTAVVPIQTDSGRQYAIIKDPGPNDVAALKANPRGFLPRDKPPVAEPDRIAPLPDAEQRVQLASQRAAFSEIIERYREKTTSLDGEYGVDVRAADEISLRAKDDVDPDSEIEELTAQVETLRTGDELDELDLEDLAALKEIDKDASVYEKIVQRATACLISGAK